jgi:hypothetical protein
MIRMNNDDDTKWQTVHSLSVLNQTSPVHPAFENAVQLPSTIDVQALAEFCMVHISSTIDFTPLTMKSLIPPEFMTAWQRCSHPTSMQELTSLPITQILPHTHFKYHPNCL